MTTPAIVTSVDRLCYTVTSVVGWVLADVALIVVALWWLLAKRRNNHRWRASHLLDMLHTDLSDRRTLVLGLKAVCLC